MFRICAGLIVAGCLAGPASALPNAPAGQIDIIAQARVSCDQYGRCVDRWNQQPQYYQQEPPPPPPRYSRRRYYDEGYGGYPVQRQPGYFGGYQGNGYGGPRYGY